MPNLRGRSKSKKSFAEEEERESRSPLMETEMDRLRRNAKEEEGAQRKSWDSGRSERTSPHKGADQRDEDAQHQKGFLLLSGSRLSVDDQEEETDVDQIPLSKQEKFVTWTDACQTDGCGIQVEVKTEERIKHQLFSGVC